VFCNQADQSNGILKLSSILSTCMSDISGAHLCHVSEFYYCLFQIGKAKVLKKSGSDKVLIIGAGLTLH
jgi:hypothetical protein